MSDSTSYCKLSGQTVNNMAKNRMALIEQARAKSVDQTLAARREEVEAWNRRFGWLWRRTFNEEAIRRSWRSMYHYERPGSQFAYEYKRLADLVRMSTRSTEFAISVEDFQLLTRAYT